MTSATAPVSTRVGALVVLAFLGMAGLAGCAGGASDGASGTTGPTSTPSETVEPTDGTTAEPTGDGTTPTSEGTPGATDEDGVRFRARCFNEDGRQLGDFQSLAETWASSNYLKIEFCEARYVGPEPLALTLGETAAAEIAAAGGDGDRGELFLRAYAACTRLGADEGEHSIAGTPLPILEATLEYCPQAPQAGLIASWIEKNA